MRPRRLLSLFPALAAVLMGLSCVVAPDSELAQSIGEPGDGPTDRPGLENVVTLAPGLISGGEPQGDAGYATLRELGVRTVISTDAVAPDLARAEASGIRVVHLPIGYGDLSEARMREMAAAISSVQRPIYVHCHHGKHRGPAALAVGALGSAEINTDQALVYLERAGTSENYAGLWRSVERARPIPAADLGSLAASLPASDVPEGTAAIMATIDRAHERLWLVADNEWATPEDHPDLSPISDAGLIHDLLRSLGSLEETAAHGEGYAEELDASIETARMLEAAVDRRQLDRASELLSALADACIACHSAHRN